MLEISGLLVFGFIVGTYGTLIGIGGGPLHVPFLMLFYGMLSPVEIIATSLMAILFNVVSGSYCYWRQGKIDLISGTKFGIVAVPGALLATLITKYFTLRFLEILFGLLLLGLAVYVFFSALMGVAMLSSKNKRTVLEEADDDDTPPLANKTRYNYGVPEKLTKRVIRDAYGNKYVYWFNEKMGLIISAIIGFIGPLIGIGGGVFHVPAMTEILKFPAHVATATAHYVLLICVVFALLPYISMGSVHYNLALPIGIGSVFGARLGAHLSRQVSGQALFKLLALGLVILSIRLLFFP